MDNNLIQDQEYVKITCKIGQGHDCCRYLTCGKDGFWCAKWSDHHAYLDKRVAEQDINARGDNCAGYAIEMAEATVPV